MRIVAVIFGRVLIEFQAGILPRLWRPTVLARTAGVLGGAIRAGLWAPHVGIGASPEHP